ncbi:hypothetical protein ABZ143_002797 [Listeria monocytogenes]|jgi:hypothetical protein
MRELIEKFLTETKKLSDDTVLGEVVGTEFYWKYGKATKRFWERYFDSDCVVTMKHLRYLANLELKLLDKE